MFDYRFPGKYENDILNSAFIPEVCPDAVGTWNDGVSTIVCSGEF